jgi:hypothetical protein
MTVLGGKYQRKWQAFKNAIGCQNQYKAAGFPLWAQKKCIRGVLKEYEKAGVRLQASGFEDQEPRLKS